MKISHISAATFFAIMSAAPGAFGQDGARAHQERARAEATRPAFLLHKASTLDGVPVESRDGESLGSLHDILMDPRTGSLDYGVVSVGGILGIGDELFAVPFANLEAMHRGEEPEHFFLLSGDMEQLKSAPKFSRDKWPVVDSEWERRIHEHFGSQPAATSGSRRLVRCTDLDGHEVQGLDESDLGSIDEVVIDPIAGRASYFVLGTGGVLGLGEKHFALPWGNTRIRYENGDELIATYPTTEEQLEKAPEYDPENWQRMSAPVFVREIYVFHSVDPYWSSAIDASAPKGERKDGRQRKEQGGQR